MDEEGLWPFMLSLVPLTSVQIRVAGEKLWQMISIKAASHFLPGCRRCRRVRSDGGPGRRRMFGVR